MLVVCFIYVETTQKAVSHKKMKRTDLYFFYTYSSTSMTV